MARGERARAEGLETELERCRVNCFERDRRIARLEAELELSRSAAASQIRGLAALGVRLEELLVGARGQATRIRLQALREAAEVSLRVRGMAVAPTEVTDPLLRSLALAIDRVGTEWNEAEAAEARDADGGEGTAGDETDRPGAAAAGGAEAAGLDAAAAGVEAPDGERSAGDELEELEAAVGSAGSLAHAGAAAGTSEAGEGAPARPVAAPTEADRGSATPPADGGHRSANHNGRDPAPRRVSVDIGPFRDFSQLVSFEDAANAIGATGEIAIRRFSAGRASIEVPLTEPVDLLAELERRCDLEFRVRSAGDDEIVLDLD